ncbi:unnamed protein product [Schistocephalus solidus]|uniref:Uncharacterized protein n=1 Tax=Schistocephalus solidus TaxID=70667 RepID=A0A183TIE3_SCHSO|nr:unnamed protein product [Schistocephalus solidus]
MAPQSKQSISGPTSSTREVNWPNRVVIAASTSRLVDTAVDMAACTTNGASIRHGNCPVMTVPKTAGSEEEEERPGRENEH